RIVAAAAPIVAQGGDELMRFGLSGRSDHLFFRCIRCAQPDVVTQRAMKQGRVLTDDTDTGSQRTLGDRPYILTVDVYRTALGIVEAQDKVDQRGLARA